MKEGLAKYRARHSVYQQWKRQLAVGVRASLRNSKPLKASDLRRLEAENKKLKEVVLNQSLILCELKIEMNWTEAGGRLMSMQQAAILQMVEDARRHGRGVGEVLATLGIKRSHLLPVEEGCGRKVFLTKWACVDADRAHTDR